MPSSGECEWERCPLFCLSPLSPVSPGESKFSGEGMESLSFLCSHTWAREREREKGKERV